MTATSRARLAGAQARPAARVLLLGVPQAVMRRLSLGTRVHVSAEGQPTTNWLSKLHPSGMNAMALLRLQQHGAHLVQGLGVVHTAVVEPKLDTLTPQPAQQQTAHTSISPVPYTRAPVSPLLPKLPVPQLPAVVSCMVVRTATPCPHPTPASPSNTRQR